MNALTLYIGNKNYSSWSMRPWLVLRKAQLPFEEQMIQLDIPGFKDKLLALSAAGTVPVLRIGDEMIPDSLAICEWAALAVPNLWPKDPGLRKEARIFCRRLQDEFADLRTHAPMNLRRRSNGKMPKSCLVDADKLADIWCDYLSSHAGPFLFGDWSIADAFSTPYATRFAAYDLPRDHITDTYISELMSDEDYLDWEAEGLIETWELPETDAVNL